jgi:transposase
MKKTNNIPNKLKVPNLENILQEKKEELVVELKEIKELEQESLDVAYRILKKIESKK